jgi:thiol-disulfide isomerase/thioredoxin
MRRRALLAAALALALLANRSGEQVGRAAPDCALTELGGEQPIDLARYRGQVLWLDFWASWCGSCAESFPYLNGLQREFGARGFQVLAVNLDEEPRDAQAFLALHPARFALAADASGRCPRDFGVERMPTAVLIDRAGVIRHVQPGFRAGEAEALRARVAALLAEGAGDAAR